MGEDMKECSRCGGEKPATAEYFHRDRGNSDGLHSYCKPCIADYNADRRLGYHLKSRYGLTVDEFEEMVEAQGGTCAICNRPPQGERLHVDHKGDDIRGLLCNSCNTSLGKLGDDLEGLMRAVDYLRGE